MSMRITSVIFVIVSFLFDFTMDDETIRIFGGDFGSKMNLRKFKIKYWAHSYHQRRIDEDICINMCSSTLDD